MVQTSRWVLLALILTLGACNRAPGAGGGASSLPEWKIDATPVVSIGEVTGDSSYIFADIAAVRLLPDGQILVADRSSGTLRLYDGAGHFEHEMGRPGKGPGEFVYLGNAFLAPPDTILAYDAGSYRLTKFLMDGGLANTVTFHAPDGMPEIYLGTFGDGLYALAWISQGPRDWSRISADVMRVGRFRADGTMVGAVATDLGMRRLRSPLPFSPSFSAVMLGDTIFHTDGLAGRVEATGETGDSIRTFHVTGKVWTLQAAIRRLETALDSAHLKRLDQLEGTAGLDTIPTISDVLPGEGDRLWLKTYDPATDNFLVRMRTGGEWLVVETSGTPVARVAVPADVRLMEIRGSRVAGVATDTLGVEHVQVFALHRG
jgi:hypothetical protein